MGIPALHLSSHDLLSQRGTRRRLVVPALAGVLAMVIAQASLAAQEQAYGPVAGPQIDVLARELPAGLPLSLAALADRALSDNPQVVASRAALAASQADLDAAQWLRYPSLTAEALAVTGGSNAADIDGFAVNVALEQPIWAGGTINSQIDAARGLRDAGIEGLREARFGILIGIIDAWFGAVRAEERARALEAGIADHRALVASIERRMAQEVSPLADLTLARSRTTQLEIELAAVLEAGDSALVRLGELAGDVPDSPVMPDPALFAAVPPEPIALEDMIACAPAIRRVKGEIAAAEAEVRAAKGSLYPQLLLQLSQNELTGARAAVVLRAQTGNGLSQFSAIDRADARVDQSIAQLGAVDREIRARLGNEYVALRSNQAQADAGAYASTAAADLQASYQRQFIAGRRSWLDVLNAAREVVTSRVAEGDARVNAAANATRILALSCRWRPAGL